VTTPVSNNRPPLPEDELLDCVKQAQQGDEGARNRVIEANLRLVWSIVGRFVGSGVEPDDLFQIGSIGLLKAVDNFDFSYSVRFSTYAVPMIIGEIRRFLRDHGPMKVSRSLKELGTKAKAASERLRHQYGREATLSEIAKDLKVSPEEIVEASDSLKAPASLEQVVFGEGDDAVYLGDQLADEAGGGDESPWMEKLALKEALSRLDSRERSVIIWRFFGDKTQSEVAEMIGLSQPQVSRIEKSALKSIRSLLSEEI